MRSYKPKAPFCTAMKILKPTQTMVLGSPKITYSDPETSELFNGSFQSYGGTENISNDVLMVFATAIIETWYRPDIKSDSRIYICETGETYEVIGEPEDIQMRHQYLKFKVQKVGGKV
jgi:hypothetical protein